MLCFLSIACLGLMAYLYTMFALEIILNSLKKLSSSSHLLNYFYKLEFEKDAVLILNFEFFHMCNYFAFFKIKYLKILLELFVFNSEMLWESIISFCTFYRNNNKILSLRTSRHITTLNFKSFYIIVIKYRLIHNITGINLTLFVLFYQTIIIKL